MNVLVCVAHPDDEILGASGAILHHIKSGDSVSVVILGTGISSRFNTSVRTNSLINSLREQALNAASCLGLDDIRFYDFPDNRFDTVPLLDIVKTVEQLIIDFKPSIVYTHHPSDLNVDHQIVSRAVSTACRPLPSSFVKSIYFIEIPSATGWQFTNTPFVPNVFLDITHYLDLKIKAFECYSSELCEFPHARSPCSFL